MAVTFFLVVTSEINDLFRQWIAGAAGAADARVHLLFLQPMALAAAWALYGLTLVLIGRRTGLSAPAYAGLLSIIAALLTAAARGIAYHPVSLAFPILNARFAAAAVVIAALFAAGHFLRGMQGKLLPGAARTAPFAGLFMLLLLLSAETRDFFERLIALSDEAGGAEAVADTSRLQNLKQLSLSGVWLLFSAAIMAAGLVRRVRPLRLMAIGLLGFTILKIFLYDLSFLETLYRIFSFIGLGAILLAASYAYQRNKELILGRPG